MSIGTYAELKTALTSWSKRSDLSSMLGDFITLAEARLNDALLLKEMEVEQTLTATAGRNYVSLPAGFVSPVAMWIQISVTNSVRTPMTPALPSELQYSVSSSIPTYYAIDGDKIRFDCPANAGYTMPFRFIKRSNLSDANPTNQLLGTRPDVYLAAGMVEIARYTRDQDLFAAWEAKFLAAATAAKAADSRSRSNTPLRTDINGHARSGGRSRIFSG